MIKSTHGLPFQVASEALDFILAGRSVFDLRSNKTLTGIRYEVKQNKKNPGSFFIHVMRGNDLLYLGIYDGTKVFVTKNSKVTEDDQEFKAINWAINKLRQGQIPDGLEVRHYGTCGACGRDLEDALSIARGIGPTCYKRSIAA